MKLLLLIACLLFVACGYDGSGYDGSGTQCDQYAMWENRAKCFKDYSKELEKEIEILKLKMEYGCTEPKAGE